MRGQDWRKDWNQQFSTLLEKLNLPNLESTLRNKRLRWLGHVLRSDGWIKEITELRVESRNARGGPRKNWNGQIEKDLRLVGLTDRQTDRQTDKVRV